MELSDSVYSSIVDNDASGRLHQVLVIEDNPGDARFVDILLRQSDLVNCSTENVQALRDGIDALHEKDYSAVLLDLTLPDSTGLDTLERLLEEHPNANVIVMTGISDKTIGVEAVKRGAQDFIIKGGIDPDTLGCSVRFSIERSNVKKRLEETQRIAAIDNWEYRVGAPEITFGEQFARIFGMNVSSVPIEEVMQQSHPLHSIYELQQLAREQGTVRRDLRVVRPDGSIRYASAMCRCEPGNDGPVFMGIIQDITNRKQAELEMEKSQARYQEIFSQSRDAIYVISQAGKFVDINEATCLHFGISESVLKNLPNPHEKLFYDRDEITEFLNQLYKNRSVKDFEIKTRYREKEMRYCLLSASLIENEDFRGYSAILRDITERKQTEKLRKDRDLAEKSAQMREQFIASVSHEMRTPMNAILGMSNILNDMTLPEDATGLVGNIKQSSEILLGIVNDILEISTIQNGKVVFESNTFDLRELLAGMMNVMQYKAHEKDLYFEWIVDDAVP